MKVFKNMYAGSAEVVSWTNLAKITKKSLVLKKAASHFLAFFVFMVISGCSEYPSFHRYTGPEETPAGTFKDCNLDETSKRIAVLDMTVVAPGAGVTVDHLRTMQILRDKYGVNIPLPAIANKASGYCADSVKNRLKFMNEAIASPHHIIWAIRGGFGSNMLIEEMDKWPIPKEKKIFVGFSDTTSIQLFVTQKWGWKSVHAPVLIHLSDQIFSPDKFETLLGILEGTVRSYEINKVYPINSAARLKKTVEGRLTGGNLTLLEASIGTSWEVEVEDKILCVEDINLKPWWIYRSMYHLKESGRLKGVKAIVFGRFVKSGVSQSEVARTLASFAETLDIPVYATDQFGHGNHNMPLVYDAKAVLHNNKMSIEVDWS